MNFYIKNLLIPSLFTFFSILIYYQWSFSEICILHPNASYTYIIVGAGTAGCVLAARLSENPNNKILLIEAGDHFNTFSKIPSLSIFLQKSSNDWLYESVPQKWSSFGFRDKKQALARGKGLGGSGQMNFLIYNGVSKGTLHNLYSRDNLMDFIRGAGCLNSSYYLDRLMVNQNKSYVKCKPNFPFHVKSNTAQLGEIIKNAIRELQNSTITFCQVLSSIFKGERWSTYHSHLLSAVHRPNLHIMCNNEVSKVVFKNKRAVGVQYPSGTIYSEKEIILAAGSINSPKLLLLSGVGNTVELETLGIPTITNLPGVGLNLHDHMAMPLYVQIKSPLSLTLSKMLSLKEIFNYILYRKGLYATSPVAAITKSRTNFLLAFMGSTPEYPFCTVANYLPETFRNLFPFFNSYYQEGFVLLAGCKLPKSRGFIKLNRNKTAVIDPQYLNNEDDLKCIKNAVRLASNMLNTTSFEKVGASLHLPELEQCNYTKSISDDNYLECIIRTSAITSYHLAGTCKMGNDTLSVVDYNFRVRNVKGIRVIDGSVLPKPINNFPNTAIAIVAEYAATLLT